MGSFRRILVAVDYSPESDAALDVAIDLTQSLDADLHLVHAYETGLPVVMAYDLAIPESYIAKNRAEADKRLEEEKDAVSQLGLRVHTHLVNTPAAAAIVETATQIGADLIVMGTRGLTGLKHVVLGSVAEHTLRLAHCSVMTVKVDKGRNPS